MTAFPDTVADSKKGRTAKRVSPMIHDFGNADNNATAPIHREPRLERRV